MRRLPIFLALPWLAAGTFSAAAPARAPIARRHPVARRAPAGPVFSARADLDGDGKPETIRLIRHPEIIPGTREPANGGKFELVVTGTVRAQGDYDCTLDGFRLVDLDRSDHHQEIDVETTGPSDQSGHQLYWYEQGKLTAMGSAEGGITPLGNGVVVLDRWSGLFETKGKCVLQKDHTIREVRQEFYTIGVTRVCNAPVDLHVSRGSKESVAHLTSGSKAEVVLWDGKNWYLVRTPHGFLGWLSESEMTAHFRDVMQLP